MRTIYAVNAIGRYIAREKALYIGGGCIAWVEVSRVYENALPFAYPTQIETGK